MLYFRSKVRTGHGDAPAFTSCGGHCDVANGHIRMTLLVIIHLLMTFEYRLDLFHLVLTLELSTF